MTKSSGSRDDSDEVQRSLRRRDGYSDYRNGMWVRVDAVIG
jgi:hypothetical protein